MTIPLPDDELTELHDARIPRVDLVDKGANGIPRFLITKQDGESRGLLDPDLIRELIAKADPEPESERGETVTMTGSPAAIAKMIHAAAIRDRDVTKDEQSTATQNDLPDSAFAYIESGGTKDAAGKTTPRSLRHFPINDEAHVRNALSRAPQSPFGDKAMPKIKAAAKKYDIEVSKEMETTDVAAVTKDLELDDGVDGMDPTVILAAPDTDDAPGDPMDPGSPAWEAIDAATATKWTSILARAKAAIDTLSQREMLEAASGDEGDAENAWDLDDACCAIDFAISVLAPFAIAEQSEADCGTDMMAAVGKALGDFDTAPLGVIEAFGTVAKAGRVLSASNEAAIRGAAESLQKVLASLPQAPAAPEDGQPVAKQKEETMAVTETPAADVASEPVAKTEQVSEPTAPEAPAAPPAEAPVAKAAKPPQVAIYDASGNLVGTVDPAEITTLAPAVAPDPAGPDTDGDGTPDADDVAPAVAPATTADLTPAPAAAAGVPADAVATDDDGNVTKTTDPANGAEPIEKNDDTTNDNDGQQDVLKSTVEGLVKAALDGYGASQEQVIAKQAEDLAQQAKVVKMLEDRLEKVENAPAVMAIASNGAIPQPQHMRGQGHGAPVDMTEGQQLRKQLADSDDAVEKKRIADRMQTLAIEELGRLQHPQRR